MPIVKFILNIGLISAMLIAPALLLLATWYRKHFRKAVVVWRRPEAILATVSYFVFALLLTIVGMACLFNYLRDTSINPAAATRYKEVAFICILFWVSGTLIFSALRFLMVQVILKEGIMLNHSLFRIPMHNQILSWDSICDYYTQTDYPNVVFTIIYKTEGLHFEKTQIYVPSHLQNFLKDTLDAKLDGEEDAPFFRFGRRKNVN